MMVISVDAQLRWLLEEGLPGSLNGGYGEVEDAGS